MPYALTGLSFVRQNTTATNQGDLDMMTWPSTPPVLVDKYGKLIQMVRWLNAGDSTKYHTPVVSDDAGLTWREPARSGFHQSLGEDLLTHGAYAYDPTNDIMYALFVLDISTGIIVVFRSYTFTRDAGTHNITLVTRVLNVVLEVGSGSMSAESPFCLWIPEGDTGNSTGGVYFTVVAGWSAVNAASASGSKAEIRLTMRRLNNDAGDNNAANWIAPMAENGGLGASDTLGSSGLPKYSCVAKSAYNQQPFFSITRRATTATYRAGQLMMLYSLGGVTTGAWRWNRAVWNATAKDWSSGLASGAVANDSGARTVSTIALETPDVGYNLKFQLPAKIVDEPNGARAWLAFPTWWTNALGDTWTIAWIALSSNDTLSTRAPVYSAGGAHSYAPCGDIFWDEAEQAVLVTYIKTGTQFVYAKAYQGASGSATMVMDETPVFTSAPVDIPYTLPVKVGGRIAYPLRDTVTRGVSPPGPDRYYGYFGTGVFGDTGGGGVAAQATAAGRSRLGRSALLLDKYLTDAERNRLREIYAVRRGDA